MSEAKKAILGLFRSHSQMDNRHSRISDSTSDRTQHRNEQHNHHHQKRSERPKGAASDHRRDTIDQTSVPPPSHKTLEKDDSPSSISNTSPPPWHRQGFTSEKEMTPEEAARSVALGVPIYKGSRKSIPNASEDYYALYACCDGGLEGGSDTAEFYKSAFAAMSFQIQDPGLALHPWDTLEQPSLAFCYGKLPGTVSLNYWVGLSGHLKKNIELRDPGVRPREVDLDIILDRLSQLESDVDDDEELMYKTLYKKFLKDPDKFWAPHKAMERQIADLITVLSGPQWIDFSNPRNQIVPKFFSNVRYTDEGQAKMFLYQVLLSIELDIRIHSKHHAPLPKQKLLSQLPPRIVWDLALARKWKENIGIPERPRDRSSARPIEFHLKSKKRQVKALRKFAKALNWPNLSDLDEVLRSKDRDMKALEDRSSDAMAYFSGLVLPGATLPWLLMNSLVDCDRESGEYLSLLTHMYPHCGFQYRSTTYWSSSSIVGKVLGPTCREIAGWIGPARPAPDLERIQIARIRQRRPRQAISPKEVLSMAVRSDPLGPPAKSFPVVEYQLVIPDPDGANLVRIEKLSLKPVSITPSVNGTRSANKPSSSTTSLFDACMQFAIDGRSWPLRLSFDVSYVNAFPCTGGPHLLFYDYIYKAVKVDEILTIANWGGLTPESNTSVTGTTVSGPENNAETRRDDNDVERVLVVEAFGVPDNEVLARAYCSHWGLSAIIANVKDTCMACAIREAYAACLNVVILVQGDIYTPDHD